MELNIHLKLKEIRIACLVMLSSMQIGTSHRIKKREDKNKKEESEKDCQKIGRKNIKKEKGK